MAKIAGRKNDGAWTRFNDWIINQEGSVGQAFVALLQGSPTADAAFEVIFQYATDLGLQEDLFPGTLEEWLTELSVGVPRQIWDGVTTYDKYTRTGSSGDYTYTKLMQAKVFAFSVQVRHAAKVIRFGAAELKHLAGLTRRSGSAVEAVVLPKKERQALKLAEVRALIAADPEKHKRLISLALTDTGETSKGLALRPRTSQPKGRKTADA